MKCVVCKKEEYKKIWGKKRSYYCSKCNPEIEKDIERRKALRELNNLV